ncbi:MAG: single-stranded DNA-binding protein [Acidobacteria bacterium]|nr:single-stranded DNA-binding protein [Acidobacteriota bacterium]
MSFNKITLVGYLGRDPELRYTPQGTAVCKMSVATTERRKNVVGDIEEHTTWFRVTVWGRQAELANEYLAKGRQVYLEGRLRLVEYADREGNPRISPDVTATDIQFLGQRNEMPASVHPSQVEQPDIILTGLPLEPAKFGSSQTAAKPVINRRTGNQSLVSIEEDDIPF